MPARAPSLAAFALALAACAPAAAPGPTPLAIAPAQGAPDAPLDVEITGRGFEPAVRTDYGDPSASALGAGFEARLAPAAGGAEAPLEAVALTPRGTLTARVPAGLAVGSYDLVVLGPDGRTGTLRDAFEVVSAAEAVETFRFAPVGAQAAGIPFAVAISAVDAAGRVVTGFSGTATLQDESGTATPTALGPFSLGRVTVLVTVPVLAASDRLTARDALGRAGVSDAFPVTAGPPVRLVFAAAPASAKAGACVGPVELEARDALGQPAPPAADLPVRLDASPPGAAAFFSDARCLVAATGISLPAGVARAAFHVRAPAPGAVVLRAVPTPLPSVEQEVSFAP